VEDAEDEELEMRDVRHAVWHKVMLYTMR
jgi:hypothetical protein